MDKIIIFLLKFILRYIGVITCLCLNTVLPWEEIKELFKTFFPTLNIRTTEKIFEEEIENIAKRLEIHQKEILEELEKIESKNPTRIEIITNWYKQNRKIEIIDP